MSGAYPYKQLPWYPHLSPAEAAIWHRYIAANPDKYDTVDYDVKLGSIPEFVQNDTEVAGSGQAGNYQYKIDVVGYKGDTIDIIELKQRATMRALGQVTGYRDLYVRDMNPDTLPKRVVITDALMPDMEHLASEAGVEIIVV